MFSRVVFNLKFGLQITWIFLTFHITFCKHNRHFQKAWAFHFEWLWSKRCFFSPSYGQIPMWNSKIWSYELKVICFLWLVGMDEYIYKFSPIMFLWTHSMWYKQCTSILGVWLGFQGWIWLIANVRCQGKQCTSASLWPIEEFHKKNEP